MKELDPNKIAIELVKQFAKPIFESVGKLTNEAHNKLKVTLNTCFADYIVRSYDKYSKTKTLLYRDAPVSLKDFYVRTDLQIGFDNKIKESDFIEQLKSKKRTIISGTAGSGKSTFCKSILLDLIENPIGIFPIFVELRHLNSDEHTSLFDFILKSLTEIEPTFTKSQLDYSLTLGKVLLIFDGFDELNNELRDKYEKEVVNLASKYHNILMLLSSRPDGRFQSWEEFYTYRILPLDKEKSKALISKLDYDRQVKRKFLEILDQQLFDQHESFASNPLLLTMMLLTYEQIAEIPNKIHLFYEQAFLTLFNKHDSLKSLYKRKSHSNLPLDDFKKLLAAFSIVSYADRKYYFTEDEINKYLKIALKISGIELDEKLFLKDLLDTVCIMQKDGNGYTFTHRSFQEYFTSIFLVTNASDNKFKLIDKIAFVNDRDDVIPMVFDINKDLLEQEWIVPRMESMVKELSIFPDTAEGRVKYLSLMYQSLIVHEGFERGEQPCIAFRLDIQEGDHNQFFQMLYKIYNDEISDYRKKHNINEPQNEAYTQLLHIVREKGEGVHRDLSLENIAELDADTITLIYQSNCSRHLDQNLNYVKDKLFCLREKYANKQEELSELFFG